MQRRLLASIAAVLAACVPLVTVPADAPALRVALTQEPGTLNPVVATLAIESDLFNLIFSGLTRYNERGERVPDLATVVPTLANGGIARDGRSITYHLVRNARWHDGVPVTSDDVKFTFEAITNPANNIANRDPYDRIARVETPDRYTARLVLKRPWAPTVDAFSDRLDGAIVPAHLLRRYPDLNRVDFALRPIGSGPFRFVAWHHGSDIELEADPHYFRGRPAIPRIRVRFLTNDNTMLVALRTHELDLADGLNLSTYTALGDLPAMVSTTVPKSFYEHLTFNTSRPPLDDRRVRLALCYGLDVHEVLGKIARGVGALGPTDQNPATSWYNAKAGPLPFDPERAQRLLAEAGWLPGPDGVRVRAGTPLQITLISTAGNATREQTEVLLQQRWRAIGVDVVVKNYPAATIFAPASAGGPFYGGNFDVALSAFIRSIPDPGSLNTNGADFIPPHGNNLSRFRSAELTSLEVEGASTFDAAQRKHIYDRIQLLLLRDVPFYTLRWNPAIAVFDRRLGPIRPTVVNSTFWNVAAWRWNESTR